MTDDESRFVESMARFMSTTSGWTPMAGRMWAWLLICEPPEQSAAELAEALGASRGAISGAARVLEVAGLARRATRRGDRREYFAVPAEAIEALVAGAGVPLQRFRQIAEAGLALLTDRPAESRARLQSVHDVYAFFEQEWPALIGRLAVNAASEAGSAGSAKGAA